MGRRFKRLTVREREVINRYYYRGYNPSKISKILGVHRSTIYREIKRNKFDGHYIHLIAQDINDKRRNKSYKRKIREGTFLIEYVEEKLKLNWTPEAIAGRLKLTFGETKVCHETIYAYVFSPEGIEKKLYKYLHSRQPRRFPKIARKKTKRSLIPNRISIHERPKSINNRDDFAHWEVCRST